MADYYTNFSVVLALTKEQKDYAMQIVKQVEEHRFQDKPLPETFPATLKDEIENWAFETELTEQGLWIHSQYGGQDAACSYIQHLLQRFKVAEGVTLEWSHDCSKPRTDAYGGGAAWVTRDQIQSFTTAQWLREVVGKTKTLCEQPISPP